MLNRREHNRDAAGLKYVYPVISRRAGGLSIGINLNCNNACNWRCIYCQVPELKRGTAPVVDLSRLRIELAGFLRTVVDGSFFEGMNISAEDRRIRDVALSGNGEPTSAGEFHAVVDTVAQEMVAAGLVDDVKLVLITNGSLIHRPEVQKGLVRMSECNGEVWFKVDAATSADIRRINGAVMLPDRVFWNLELAASLCTTWIQTCMFALDGEPAADRTAYLVFLKQVAEAGVPVAGILLYSLARTPMQAEAGRLSSLSADWLLALGEDIRSIGMTVRVTP